MTDDRDAIRSRIDIVDLISQRVPLKRAGKHWKGLCPFHDDRNPSFSVSPTTGQYRCWSCGETGDIFTWVMKTQNVEFGEAMKMLADMAGVTLTRTQPAGENIRSKQLSMMLAAQGFFREQLDRNPDALKYLERRGISPDVAETWGLGFAPDADTALATSLSRFGYRLSECKELFLVEEDSSGSYYDKFRGRLMFPIHDERGDLVAFGGRALGDVQPKYINSSDTPLYRKSRILYGLNKARDALSKERHAILVEGYLDVIACHRAGLNTAIASLGTSLAEDHARLLKRWCDRVTILYDSDEAGKKAAGRASEMLMAAGLDVAIALMPPGEDPDTLLKEAGPAAVRKAAEQGISRLQFQLLRLESQLDTKSPEFWREAIQALAACETPSLVESEVVRMAGTYLPGGREGNVISLLEQVRNARKKLAQGQKGHVTERVQANPAQNMASLLPAERIIFLGILSPEYRTATWKLAAPERMISQTAIAICEALATAFGQDAPSGPASIWLQSIQDESSRQALIDVEMASEMRPGVLSSRSGQLSAEMIRDAVDALANDIAEQQIADIRSSASGLEDVEAAWALVQSKFDRKKQFQTD